MPTLLSLMLIATLGCPSSPDSSPPGQVDLERSPAASRTYRDAIQGLRLGGPDARAALDSLDALSRRYPAAVRLRNVLHNAHLERADWGAAIDVFVRSAVELSPDDEHHLGKLYAKAGRFDDAIARLAPLHEPALAAGRAEDPDLARDLAQAYLGAARYDEAAACLESAWASLRTDRDALRMRGLIAFYRGDHEAALRDLNACVERAPDWGPGHYALGRVLAAAGDTDGARRHMARFEALSGASTAETNRQMWLSGRSIELTEALRSRRWAASERIAREMIEAADDSLKVQLYQALAHALREDGRTEEALKALLAAEELRR